MNKLYLVFAFSCEEDSILFTNTLDFDLPKEMQILPIDWSEWTFDDVTKGLGKHFENNFSIFALCEFEFNEIRLLQIKNEQMSAG